MSWTHLSLIIANMWLVASLARNGWVCVAFALFWSIFAVVSAWDDMRMRR